MMYKISVLKSEEAEEIENKNYVYHFKKYDYVKKQGKKDIRCQLEGTLGKPYYEILVALRKKKALSFFEPLVKDGMRACADHLITYFEGKDVLLSLFSSKRISNADARRRILKLFACWILQN